MLANGVDRTATACSRPTGPPTVAATPEPPSEALPLKLEHCHTRLARGEDAEWITRRFIDACAELGSDAAQHDDRIIIADLR